LTLCATLAVAQVKNGGHVHPSLDSDSASNAATCSRTAFASASDTCFSFISTNNITINEFNALNGEGSCTSLVSGKLYCFAKADPVIIQPDTTTTTLATAGAIATVIAPVETSSAPQPSPSTVCSGAYTNTLPNQQPDLCASLQSAFDLSPKDFAALNPSIECNDGIGGKSVCLQGQVNGVNMTMQPRSVNLTATHPIDSCTKNVTLGVADNCVSVATQNSVTITQLVAWNYNLNCWNLTSVENLCVAAPVSPSVVLPFIATQANNTVPMSNNTVTTSSATSTTVSTTTTTTESEPTTTTTTTDDTVQAATTTQPAPPAQENAPSPPSEGQTVQVAAQISAQAPVQAPAQQNTNPSSTTNISPADISALLQAHNTFRSQYGIAALSWDDSIATSAAARWAANLATQGCALVHGDHDNLGQNLYMMAGSAPPRASMADMVGAWTSEGLQDGYNHATQVAWYSTKTVGCAIQWGSGGLCEVLVCDYFPAGNMVGTQFNGAPGR
ncbi:hypothetical protein BC830DRAFT_1156530, partial [Chytriomyces sp. MP71]